MASAYLNDSSLLKDDLLNVAQGLRTLRRLLRALQQQDYGRCCGEEGAGIETKEVVVFKLIRSTCQSKLVKIRSA